MVLPCFVPIKLLNNAPLESATAVSVTVAFVVAEILPNPDIAIVFALSLVIVKLYACISAPQLFVTKVSLANQIPT